MLKYGCEKLMQEQPPSAVQRAKLAKTAKGEGAISTAPSRFEEVQVVRPGPLLSSLSFHPPVQRVILSGAGTSRSEVSAESKSLP